MTNLVRCRSCNRSYVAAAAWLVLSALLAPQAAAADIYSPLDIVGRDDYFARYIPDPLGVGGGIVLVIKSSAVAGGLSKLPPFQLRVFRGRRDEVRKSAWAVEQDCYLFPSQLLLKFGGVGDRVRIDPQLHWRITGTGIDWLAYDSTKNYVSSQPYTFVLELGQDNFDFVVLQRDHIDNYFDAGFQITLDPPKTSIPKEDLKKLSDYWTSQQKQVKAVLENVKVRAECHSVRLQILKAEDGTMTIQLAEMSLCPELEPDAL